MRTRLSALLMLAVPVLAIAQHTNKQDVARFKQEAAAVTIIRDNYGVPHIYSKTDANAVFGLMYSQCEDNFKGVEDNYLYQLGRQTEVTGESKLFTDVQLQMIADSADAIKDYKKSPIWFKKLMDAFADGINYYLYKHPEVKSVLAPYKPWYALMFTDGSVSATVTGGLNINETQRFFASGPDVGDNYKPTGFQLDEREIGSNGYALSPSKTATHHAMLYINPHVPFYFRAEAEMETEEGLHVYGACTWGQFFVYQGFNPHCGWMHTSSNADVGDLYAEKVTKKDGKWYYEYNGQQKPVTERKLTFYIKDGDKLVPKIFTGYYTHHGPVLGARNGKWMALKADNRSYEALLESWMITKANTFDQYKNAMSLLNNATNNTVYADDQGNTAFWYGNFMPRRDPKFDWTQPVDGSITATEWKGLHKLDEIVHVYNPSTGYIINCNSTPYTSSGTASPDKTKYPPYMAPDGQNFRALNAIRLFEPAKSVNIDQLITLGYDHYLTAFDMLLPPLFKAYETANDSVRTALRVPIQKLHAWDRRSDKMSDIVALATDWGQRVMQAAPRARSSEEGTYQTERTAAGLKTLSDKQLLDDLLAAMNNLKARYGDWAIQWGTINRYQRPAEGVFNDNSPSIPVGQVSATFGELPSYVSRAMNGTKNRYGYSGNSFIAAIDFGPHGKVTAKSIMTGGQSADPKSTHYTDQAQGYIDGKFKNVLFYKADVLKHAEQTYHPGAEKK